jgi:two-component system sensor histidine kinase CpxA
LRKLYLKIVAAIWAVMLVTTVGVAVAVNVALDDRPRLHQFRPAVFLSDVTERAASATKGTGRDGLVQWFEEHVERRSPALALLDEEGKVLAGKLEPNSREAGEAVTETVFMHDGERYRIVHEPLAQRLLAQRPGPSLGPMGLVLSLRSLSFWLLLLLAVPLSVILSVTIARYLMQPLRAIEQAGRRLSEGDLSARVGSALGDRGDEIADFAAAFDRMAARIESLVRTHKDLLRDVSHELRSPLARAHAALSLARQRTGGAVDHELDRLEREIERLDTMIGKLLMFSRLDSGERETAREPVDLGELLDEVVEVCRIEAERDGKEIRLRLDDTATVTGDPALLASCFENVIRNALRHAPPGTAVEIALSREASAPGFCSVRFGDRGPGVPETELRHIFEPFYRVSDSAGSDDGHAGIGLAIAKRATVLHGGGIEAANAATTGLVVTVSLPLCESGER